jgi:gentisate 1,2-dioxygenase
MQYSSKDFAKTQPEIQLQLPERLIHRNVRQKIAGDFSRERGHGVAIVDVPSKTISMTLGGLLPGQRTRRHRHSYETVLFILKGTGFTKIENTVVNWAAGDAVYVPVWAWHEHGNTGEGDAEYLACENAPLLQNLGIAIREEAPLTPKKEN